MKPAFVWGGLSVIYLEFDKCKIPVIYLEFR